MIEFRNELIKWCQKNDINSVADIDFYDHFCYYYPTRTVILSLNQTFIGEVQEWLEEFFDSLGCEYQDIPFPVLCFLHEVGHSVTWDSFTDTELMIYSLMKNNSETKEEAFKYWSIPDEKAANQWAVNFINNHIDAVMDLWDIFYTHWNRLR